MKTFEFNGVIYVSHSKKKLLKRLYGRNKKGEPMVDNLSKKLLMVHLIKGGK